MAGALNPSGDEDWGELPESSFVCKHGGKSTKDCVTWNVEEYAAQVEHYGLYNTSPISDEQLDKLWDLIEQARPSIIGHFPDPFTNGALMIGRSPSINHDDYIHSMATEHDLGRMWDRYGERIVRELRRRRSAG